MPSMGWFNAMPCSRFVDHTRLLNAVKSPVN